MHLFPDCGLRRCVWLETSVNSPFHFSGQSAWEVNNHASVVSIIHSYDFESDLICKATFLPPRTYKVIGYRIPKQMALLKLRSADGHGCAERNFHFSECFHHCLPIVKRVCSPDKQLIIVSSDRMLPFLLQAIR